MVTRRSLLGSALGLSTLALSPALRLGAQSPAAGVTVDPDLASYLALAPASVASLEQAAPFTYGNAKLQADTLGFALPFDLTDADALQAWMNGTYTLALPSTFRNYALMDGFADLTGFDIGQVFSGAEIGEPPDIITAIRGSFDIRHIQATQLSLGYQQVDIDGQTVYSLSAEADFSPDNPIQRWALARLNNSAVLPDGTLLYTSTLELMRTALAPGATLDEQPFVPQALATLDSPLISAMVLGPAAFTPGIPLDILQPESESDIADFILAMRDRQPSPQVVTGIVGSTPGGPLPNLGEEATPVAPGEPKSVGKFALVYLTAGDAATAAGQIEERLATGSSQVTQAPWSEMLASWSAVQGADPSTVLVTMEWEGVPRTLDLVFNRDIAFITG